MNTAEKYFHQQLADDEFRHSCFQEKAKLDMEYQLEELKKAVQTCRPAEEIIRKIDGIEQYLMTV